MFNYRKLAWLIMYHPNMKSRARSAAFWWWFALEYGTNQCDTNVIPIKPFCDACTLNDQLLYKLYALITAKQTQYPILVHPFSYIILVKGTCQLAK